MFLLHSLKGVATISRGTSQSAKCWRMLIYFCYSAYFSGGVVGVYNLRMVHSMRPFRTFRDRDSLHMYSEDAVGSSKRILISSPKQRFPCFIVQRVK